MNRLLVHLLLLVLELTIWFFFSKYMSAFRYIRPTRQCKISIAAFSFSFVFILTQKMNPYLELCINMHAYIYNKIPPPNEMVYVCIKYTLFVLLNFVYHYYIQTHIKFYNRMEYITKKCYPFGVYLCIYRVVYGQTHF